MSKIQLARPGRDLQFMIQDTFSTKNIYKTPQINPAAEPIKIYFVKHAETNRAMAGNGRIKSNQTFLTANRKIPGSAIASGA